jgi:ABC-2 type transport system ATP-binding protein
MIAATGLTRKFGDRVVVDDVTFAVERGEIVALLGPNGAGKTTTLRMLAGLIAATAGTVTIDGVPMNGSTGSALRRRIGFLTEAPGLWDRLTVRENLAIYSSLYDLDGWERRAAPLLEILELAAHLERRAAELSKGMRQKVALTRALLHDPDVLLLDEPTSGLDPEVTRGVRELLAARKTHGSSILLSTHNLAEAERIADRVAVLQERLLAWDAPAALRGRVKKGRVDVRLDGAAEGYLNVIAGIAASAAADGSWLHVVLGDPDERTPRLVEALVRAGARIIEVRQDVPALEDVYLALVGHRDRSAGQ